MKTMTNWTSFPSTGARLTTWNYDAYRGWLTNKTYDGGAAGPIYSNTPAGRLATRKWARTVGGQPLVTTYGYNNAGALTRIVYSDGTTPNVTNTFDRLGRAATTICNGMTTTFSYNDASELLSESFSGGTLNGLAVTNAYDAFLRRTAVGLNTQPSTLTQFGYDSASRLAGVTNGNYNAAYAYLANSPLVSQITFRSNTVTRMTTTKSYDYLNRLASISAVDSGLKTVDSHAYTYNNANQRTRATLADGSYWLYDYDTLGQVRSGKKYWNDGTPVAGQQFEYAFDDIGNRTQAKAGGDDSGAGLRPANYSANNLNQYTNRDVPGYVDIMGLSFATNSVTVNSQTAYRKGEYFRKELPMNNSSASLWTNIIVTATGQTSVTGNLFVAKSPETFGYDADGNMTNDGRWSLTWDAENRLTKAESLSSGPTASKRKVVWEFDAKGRRIRQTTSDGSSGSYVVTEDLKFVSDGWRHIAELNATNNALVRSYVWGVDLSGSLDGAGGVGGLLMLSSVANGAHFYAYDGNGNVVAMVKGTDGTVSANYEFDPFGSVVRATGAIANENRFQFSTKRTDRSTGFVLYEYRLYVPSLGRWLNRDILDEGGGVNLYSINPNDFLNNVDPLGLCVVKQCGVLRFHLRPGAPRFSGTFPGWNVKLRGGQGGVILWDLIFAFEIYADLRDDENHDPKACRYVQLVQVTASAGGRPITASNKGVPADGSLHLDGNWPVPPGWTDDNIDKHLDLWPIPTGRRYRQYDGPGLHGVAAGTSVKYHGIFIGIIKDITRRDPETGETLTVATASLPALSATGTVPKPLTVAPGRLH